MQSSSTTIGFLLSGSEMTARKRPFDAEVMIVAKLQGIRDHTSK
jgi:hypothetical protein